MPPVTSVRSARPDPDPDPVRVLLCEDHPMYSTGLRTLLAAEPGLVVVGEVPDVEAACALADREPPQVIVVRQGLLGGPDHEPLYRLCRSGAAVLVLAESESQLDLQRALRAGARGYLSRRVTAGQLLDGVRALGRNEPTFDGIVARHLVRHLTDAAPEPPAPTPLDRLTARQRAVALLVAEGLTNDEIARRLQVSLTTVKSHLASAMRRLGIRSRTQLAILVNRGPAAP